MMPEELRGLLIDSQDLLVGLKMYQFLLDLAMEQCELNRPDSIDRAHILIDCYNTMAAIPISQFERSVLKLKASYQDGSQRPADLPPC